jgi:hypothetical protein
VTGNPHSLGAGEPSAFLLVRNCVICSNLDDNNGCDISVLIAMQILSTELDFLPVLEFVVALFPWDMRILTHAVMHS